MNLPPLFEKQRELDEKIVREKGLEGEDLLPRKILSLQVELGELANEWRGFKFWSARQEPVTKVEHLCPSCDTTGYDKISEGHYDHMVPCIECEGTGKLGESNPMLGEYVDCLHFILSIGIELFDVTPERPKPFEPGNLNITGMFSGLFLSTGEMFRMLYMGGRDRLSDEWHRLINAFILLGEELGYTEKEIERAYMDKNSVNHDRQVQGY
ncbi:dUTP diphosphatase [Salibacterium lacus]|uniref:dUTP diphosphatase n=1 Tax=Salibacterium lacus TaxID=1898109 RepID=A0ABW5T000_9BACI